MKKGAFIGGVIGLFVGVGSLTMMNFPQFLYYLFLGGVYDVIISNKGDFGEGLGWFYFIFSTLVGIVYGIIIASVVKKLQK